MRKAFLILVPVIAIAACSKEKVTMPDFEVSTTSLSYKAGDTVTFNFTGNPDNITFFSGEPGHNYEYRERTSIDNDLQVNFSTLVQFGQIRQNLQLMVSSDFNGKADTTSVKTATWTDISNLATFSTGTDNTPSGTIDLKPYTAPGKLTYVAFRYTDYKKPQGQNRWVVRTFNANNISPEGIVTPLAVMATGGWQAVNFKNAAFVWSITSAQLLMPSSTATADDNEDWVISKGFDPYTVLPDMGQALKNISTVLPAYQYVYKQPGTYKIVFEASNVRYNGEARTKKEITITITN